MPPWLRRAAPVLVSAGALAVVFLQVEAAELFRLLSWRIAAVVGPALLVYAGATLVLEAVSLRHLLGARVGYWTAARVKCASYLLGILHYGLGLAALSVLLQRRAGSSLGEAASAVLLIGSVDVALVLAVAAVASGFVETGTALSAWVVLAVLLGFVGGLFLLRFPRSLGPLERIRSLAVFESMREVPLRTLIELLALRMLFSACYVAVCASVFVAFRVEPPLALLIAGILIVTLVAALPIAVAGLGTSQLAMLAVFRGYADPETLVAMSLSLSVGLAALRAGMGLLFAREFAREALVGTRRA